MSNLATNLDLISVGQAQKEITANALFDAMSPSALYGRRANTSGGLTWGFYGGNLLDVATPINNGTLNLPVSSTCYVQADKITGVVSFNTTCFTSTSIQLYVVTTDTLTVSNYIDVRPNPLKSSGSGGSGSALQTSDEGISLSASTTSINFIGAGVTATNTGSAITVNVPGGGSGGSSSLAIKDENSVLTSTALSINFVGAGVIATTTGNDVTVNIPASSGGGGSSGAKFGSNVIFGANFDGQDTNYGGYSIINFISGKNIINLANSFQMRLHLFKGSDIQIGGIKILKTLGGKTTVIDSTIVTIAGIANPVILNPNAIAESIVDTDEIFLALNSNFDYWIVTYFLPQAGLNVGKKNTPQMGFFNAAYILGDHTNDTSIPISQLTLNQQYLISHILLLS